MTTTITKLNGIDVQALNDTVAAVKNDPAAGEVTFQVATHWKGGPRTETEVRSFEIGGETHPREFNIEIDEPEQLLGTNTAANPQEYLLAAMNACMAATYVAACSVQGIELESLTIESHGTLDLRGFLGISGHVPAGYENLHYNVRVKGSGTQKQFEDIHRWMQKTSPNYYNMAKAIQMNATLTVE